ncbi:phosphatase PAP2 family protein [Bacillus paralicheniformis]|uniref:phosphatase PAP2 family protein n=1 Tax=Bacillus paralicheniformis TaxID=1648923 RepID=UPI000C775E66|nr:phosphatase PAP2 family protein [Bacillus paralicheniformis]PLC18056.1 phosphatase PAP2 family protein [Bacillus paralicheniformis]QSG00017.1 phosphatase PAP2 family protein [Bacillus paralicheniformis]TWJ33777.1 putative undecaprenyl-diphosphatase YbjG [Bacillus paralicheniformis]TWK37977.1 putative undecaprenyl-diphosphatase YbjG [Bacillus paralicheniformis]
MNKLMVGIYNFECRVFLGMNSLFHQKALNRYFRSSTHLGGAFCTISASLSLLLFGSGSVRTAGIASAIALLVSHLQVMLIKKLYPRKRPYLTLKETQVLQNPLKDHSFPSGHTTAAFSVITPLMIFFPILALLLIPVGISVGLSRIYLGLHYPSDVLAGTALGISVGTLSAMVF